MELPPNGLDGGSAGLGLDDPEARCRGLVRVVVRGGVPEGLDRLVAAVEAVRPAGDRTRVAQVLVELEASVWVVAGALGVGIGFGLQNIVANFVAGLVLLFERPIEVGDRVTVQDVEGNVRDINFRATTVLTTDNITVIVPNSQFLNNPVTNWSHGDPRVRIHVPVGVAYGSDVEKVTRSLLGVAAATEGVLKDPAPSVFFRDFGDSSLDFELLVWIDQPARHIQIRSRINYAIDAAFRKEGIEIPFPQRDMHVRSARGLSGMLVRTGPETDPT